MVSTELSQIYVTKHILFARHISQPLRVFSKATESLGVKHHHDQDDNLVV